LVKYLAPKFKSQNFKVSLDKFGSGTWELIDGNLEVHSIADELIKKYGADIEPVYDRLPKFLTMLYKNKLISFKGLERKGK